MSNPRMTFHEAATFGGATEVKIYRTKVEDPIADLAARLAAQLAIVAGEIDGEDSVGRQKFRLLGPGEVAKRACDIADAMWQEFESRGWVIDLPEPKEASEERLAAWEASQAERSQRRFEKMHAKEPEAQQPPKEK